MRLLLTLGLILVLSLAPAIATGGEARQKTNYSKYASRSAGNERHASSADYSALNASKARRKALDGELKKLENQSHHIQTSSGKSSAPKVAPLRPVKIDSNSRGAGIDIRTRSTKTKMAKKSSSSGRGQSRSFGGKH